MKQFLSLQTFRSPLIRSGRPLGFMRSVFLLLALMSLACSNAGAETHDELVARYMALARPYDFAVDRLLRGLFVFSEVPESLKQKFGALDEKCRKNEIKIFSSNLDDSTLRKLIVWHESPIGKKIQAENRRKSSGAEAEMVFLVDFSKNPNAKQRLALIYKLDRITHYSEKMSEWYLDFLPAMDSTFTYNANESIDDEARNHTAFKELIKNRSLELVQQIKRLEWLFELIMYRNLTDEELKAYIAFNETEEGRKERYAGDQYFVWGWRLMAADRSRKIPARIAVKAQQTQDVSSQEKRNATLAGASSLKSDGSKGGIEASSMTCRGGAIENIDASAHMIGSAIGRLDEMMCEVQGIKEIHLAKLQKEMIEYREGMVPPSITNDLKPIYPEMARMAGIQGRVFVRVLIDEQGRAVKAEIVKREPMDCNVFDKVSLDAIMAASFSPGQINGKKVSVWMTVPLRFLLNDKRIPPYQGAMQKLMVR